VIDSGTSTSTPAAADPDAEILRTLQLLTLPGSVFEVRGVKPRPVSGYFDTNHLPEAVRGVSALDAAGTVEGLYLTINPVNPALLSRRANRIETRLSPGASSTGDADVIGRRWFLVDIDPIRPSGISSTDEEHTRALDVALDVAGFLAEFCTFPAPVRADSGNGSHLLYQVDLPNDDESKTLIERGLKALASIFTGTGCDVDQTVFNASRIGRLYGTVARKGDSTSDRPHRRSRILEVPEAIEAVPREALERLAALAPEEEQPRQPARSRSGGGGPNLDEWLQEYGASLPPYHAKSKPGCRSFYVFDVCPWDPSHRDRSAFMGQFNHGPLFAGCKHNGCSGNGWPELRALAEPKRPKPAPTRREARPEVPAPIPAAQRTPGAPRTLDGATLSELYEVARGGQIVIHYPRLAEVLHQEMHTLSFNEALYVYQDGVYSRDKGRISARIKEILEEIGYNGAFSVVRREALGYLLAENPQDAYPFNKCAWHLPVKNGVIRVDPGTGGIDLLPHSPEYRFSYKLPVTYDPAADSTYIRQVLEQWVEPDDVPYLLQVPAVAILQTWDCVQKQLYLFEGRHDGGKTTYCEFLYGFFGDGGYSQVDLLRLSEDRFALADLEHKLANIHDEMRAVAVRSVGQVKNLTGGLHHRIERKHENAYHAILPAVHLFTCNTPPKIKEVDDDAFWSRWVYVVFPNRFPRDDGWKAALFTEANYSAFLNLVLEVVVAVMQDRDALKRMTDAEVKERWTEAADATIKFVWAFFERDPEASVPKDDLYRVYLQYCQEAGISARAKNVLSSDLARMGIAGTRPRGGKSRVQAYAGIRWKDASLSGQSGQGILNLIAREEKEVQSTDYIYTNKVNDNPDHPDRDDSSNPLEQEGDLAAWLEGLRLPRNFTVASHRHNPARATGRCSAGRCTMPPVWEDEHGNWPLSEYHYRLIQRRQRTPAGVPS
jgi:phage/plasmid-associated DNA primase